MIKRQLTFIAITALLLASCDRHGKYESNGEIVRYSYWTFSFGERYDTLPDADPATFHSVNDWLGHDAEHVYFKDELVPDVDIASLKTERYPLFYDKKDYYYKSTPMKVEDLHSFKILKWVDDSFWAKDSKCAYFDTIHIAGADPASFKVRNWAVAADKNHVYRFGELLEHADPATYEEGWNDLYSHDKSHIWYCGELLSDADYATFKVDKDGTAHDKYGSFIGAERVVARQSSTE